MQCFQCSFRDCINNNPRLTEFEKLCYEIAHHSETEEEKRIRRNDYRRAYYQEHREKIIRQVRTACRKRKEKSS